MNALPRRALGATGLDVTVVGLGGAGVLMDRGVAASDADATAVATRALDLGVGLVDTSPIYGTDEDPRRSERRLGRSLAGRDCVVATKVGLRRGLDPLALGAAQVRASIGESQRLLGRPVLDLAQIHELTAETWDATFAPDGALAGLQRLREEGRVRHLGVTGSDPAVLERALATGAFDVVQVWRAWNLLDQSADRLLDAAHAAGVGVLVGGPLASGVLADGGDGGELHYRPAGAAELRRVERLAATCARFGVPLIAAAIRFCLDERVAAVLVGVRHEDDVRDVLQAAATPVPPALLDELRERVA